MIKLPGEIVESLRISPDGSLLALCITGARLPQDIWVLDTETGELRQVTGSPHIGVDLEKLAGASLTKYVALDGLPLTGWLYTPRDGGTPFPTVLSFHGGPEGQSSRVSVTIIRRC